MDAWRGQSGRGSRGGKGGGRGGGRGRGRGGRRGGKRGGGTLGRGGDGTPRNQPKLKLGFGELQALETKTSDEIILHLTSSRCFQATEYLFKQQSKIEDQWIVLIVSIVTKACDCSSKEDLLKLLTLLPGSSFLNLLLRRYLNKLSAHNSSPLDVVVFLRNVVKIMNELLRRFPSCYADLPLSDLYCGTMRLSNTGQLADDALVTEVDEIMKLRIKKAEELKKKEEEERRKRTKPRRDAGVNDDVDPPDNFRWLAVVPTQEDILHEGRPFLRKNKIDGSYNDVEHYLDVQFRLLQEDFVRPLRQGIAQLLERNGTAELSDIQDIRVYNNVSVLEPIYTSNGLRYRISFDNSKLRHVHWENSKRLIFGSLICLSRDRFESFMLATVADRSLAAIRRGVVDVQFINVYDQESFEEGDVYQMVESTAFFEAYRHVLEGLKEIYPGYLPMQNYIVNCQKEVEPPAYLRNPRGNQEQVTFDLTPIMRKNSYTTARSSSIPLLTLVSWPSAQDLGLDDSQFRALQMALTKEFAVIQGPPGTGKTYIGLKIASVLLHNKMKWNTESVRFYGTKHRPILVVCYTNHALDQFLEGIHQFHPEGIVRVGGRSESEILKACSLSELKHKMRKDKSVPRNIRKDLSEVHKVMEGILKELENENQTLDQCQENVLHEDQLRYRARSMTAAQYHSLKQPFIDKDGHEEESAIMHWLQLSVNPSQGEGDGTVAEAVPVTRIEVAEAEEGEIDGNENPDVLYEANVMQNQRNVGDDDVIVYKSKTARKAEEMSVASVIVSNEKGASEWKVQKPYRLKWKLEKIMRQELNKTEVMLDERAATVTDVWKLSLKDRWSLYQRWLMDACKRCRFTITSLQQAFQWGVEDLKTVKSRLDLEILKKADVIGMTTTGAAKHRDLLYHLRPRITIVEEAAEVLESHIVTSLTPGCQHLILIGDHQQLRPNPTVYDLAKHYNLDVSLFERMVKNGMPFERLRLQHRMRPEISKMLEHIYVNPKLENHESVTNFDNIKGVARNVFFVDHNESEDFTKEGKSKSNKHEAKFMAALCRYFILQGYEREQITVLTAYTGQLFQLKNEMPKDFFCGVRVCAVDNFQGEENDIILLSLVRSNEKGKIGFLQIENRVCVALSRAKKGFFCIGNISLLETKSALWRGIVSDMRERGNVGKTLMLMCQNHPKNVIQASCAEDFKKAPNGGCSIPCATRLECGHVCDMMCHPIDPEHKEYECQKPCTRKPCALNHKCPRKCYQECGPCMKPLEKSLPVCGHLQKVPCYMCEDLSLVKCQTSCVKTWPCGHEIATKCHVDPLRTPCEIPCGATLNCGHPCTDDCSSCLSGRVHVSCKDRCGRTLLCGHNCTKSCAKNCPPCRENCSNYCKHRKCTKKCGEPCDPCFAKCIWQCQHHKCTKLCRQLCNRPRCDVSCTKLLPCGHPCIGLCGEICPKKCRECHKDELTEIYFGTEDEPDARFVELADCGHVFEVEMMDQWMDQVETTHDGKPVDVQLKLCPKCRVPIRTSLRYGNIIKKILADFERIKQKIVLDKGQLDRKVAMLKGKVEEIGQFPEDQEEIKKRLNYPSLTDERINVIDNQIRLLSFLQPLKASMGYFEADERFQETKEDLESKVEQLRKRVMRFWFPVSGQELEELNEEMYRTRLLIDFRMLMMQLDIQGIKLGVTDTVKVNFVKEAFDSEKAIDKKRREQYRARIERIRREQGLQEPYQAVKREEKVLIVKTVGFTQGHWFKCPYGHFYCIKECGGAMEESKCPECDSPIGGHNHRS